MIPVVLFFARDYQAKLFPLLKSNQYKSVYVVLNNAEKKVAIDNGAVDILCLEEEYDLLDDNVNIEHYLKYSYGCDRNYVGLSLKEREIILKKTIAFWQKALDKYNPSIVLNESIAIEIAEVLAIETKKRGIKYISWMSFSKEDTFYWQPSPYHNSLKTNLDKVEIQAEDTEEANIFIEKIKEGIARPFYVSNKSTRYSILKVLKHIWSIVIEFKKGLFIPKIKRRMAYGTSISLNLWSIKLFLLSIFTISKKYDRVEDYEDRKLVFYPLHYEPEAVLFYLSYFYDNQISVIENILKCMPQSQILVVKEHPQQPGVLLQHRYREVKKRYPNLIFIKGEETTIKIINRCYLVTTLGSTVGFEALALGKNVINFGRVFYDTFEGINNCKSYAEAYQLMRGHEPFKPVINFSVFVAKMLKYIKKGNPFPNNQLYSKTNIINVTKAIEDELNNNNQGV